MSRNYKEKLKEIKTLIFDVDGVFTDNSLYLVDGQQPMRKMNVKDGYVVQLAVKCGFRLAIITGGKSETVKERFIALGLDAADIFLGTSDKLSVYNSFLSANDIAANSVLYMGDDIPDYPVLKEVGLACCPQDACDDVREICDYISPRKGGDGCVRDILEQLLRLRDHWQGSNGHTW